ncbi:MAG: hypothetical protein CME60_03110 [Halobacteriovoraceae bacterium]|nr:hypothetical protein [Halobacteriovoraceae bacterium]
MKYLNTHSLAFLCLLLGLSFESSMAQEDEGTWFNRGQVSFQFRQFKDDDNETTEDVGMLVFSRVEARYENGPYEHSFRGFARVDQKDSDRDFMAFEDVYLSMRFGEGDSWKVLAGYKLFNWTATEAFHPADVVNSRNYDSDLEYFEKLGELTLELNKEFDWGDVSFFYWPRFENPQFPGKHSRLGFGTDIARPEYIDGEEGNGDQWVAQGGARLRYLMDDGDASFHVIHHVDRNQPLTGTLNYALNPITGTPVPLDINRLQNNPTPYYFKKTQLGGTLQYALSNVLLKFEGAYRFFSDGDQQVYTASGLQKPIDHGDLAFGLEYNLPEWNYGETSFFFEAGGIVGASKEERARLSIFQRDILLGARHAFNDIMGKELLLMWVHDIERDKEDLITFSYSQRLSDIWKISSGVRIYNAPVKGTVAQGLEVLHEAHHAYFNLIRFF